MDDRRRRLLRMLVGALTPGRSALALAEAVDVLWRHPQVRRELVEVFELLPERLTHVNRPLGLGPDVPIAIHARYTRAEILSAFGVGQGTRPPTWQTGVWWDEASASDLFAFTLDKSVGGFSPDHPLPRLCD